MALGIICLTYSKPTICQLRKTTQLAACKMSNLATLSRKDSILKIQSIAKKENNFNEYFPLTGILTVLFLCFQKSSPNNLAISVPYSTGQEVCFSYFKWLVLLLLTDCTLLSSRIAIQRITR